MAIATVTDLRKIQWDKSNIWDVQIEDFKFDDGVLFFPGNDLEVTFFGVENESFGETGIEAPKKRSLPNVTLSFIDSENLTTLKYFTDWQRNLVSSDGYEVTPMNKAYRILIVTKLNSMKQPLYKWVLRVFPTGNLQYHGDSDGSVPLYSVNFTVVGGNLEWL